MEQLFDITVDAATMAALGIPERDGGFSLDGDSEHLPVDPDADGWELAWRTVHAAELPARSPQRSIREGIDHVVSLRQRMAALQVEEMRELSAIAKLSREQAEQHFPEGDPDWASSVETAQRSFVEHGAPLGDDTVRAKYERIVLERAVKVTPGRLTRTAELTATRLRGGTFEERHDAAADARNVLVKRMKDGMSLMTFYLRRSWQRGSGIGCAGRPKPSEMLETRALWIKFAAIWGPNCSLPVSRPPTKTHRTVLRLESRPKSASSFPR